LWNKASLEKKVRETLSQQINLVWWDVPVTPAKQMGKITKAKKVGGMAQMLSACLVNSRY
jgi:hypothetical protein